MEQIGGFDPEFWYVINHRYHHLVYRNKDRVKAKEYAHNRNSRSQEGADYTVISGSQLKSQGFNAAMKVPVGGV